MYKKCILSTLSLSYQLTSYLSIVFQLNYTLSAMPRISSQIRLYRCQLQKRICKIVAERLEIPFYYKEMTALAAQESGLDKEFISNLNANPPTLMHDFLMHDLYLSTNVIQQAVIAQDKVIRKIAEPGETGRIMNCL